MKGLELDEDERLQRRSWLAERVGWALMAAALAAASAALTGKGPSILRGSAVYLFLLLVFRLAGKRSLAQTTSFDLVLLLIISEVTQQAMVQEDKSLANAGVLIVTLVGLDILLSHLKLRSKAFDRVVEDSPLVIVKDGRPLRERMRKERVTEEDVLAAARQTQGLERLEQIKYAVLEVSGEISVIPA
jgi:uncharacterized membrane protein YcaP (DUF421 family)